MCYPGETDSHRFTMPFVFDTVRQVRISYKQRGKVVLEKETASVEADSDDPLCCVATIDLNQSDTLRFVDHEDIWIQANVILTDNTRRTSHPLVTKCGEQFFRQVMST